MFITPASSTPDRPERRPGEDAAARAARRAQALEELTEIGMEMARGLRRQVMEDEALADEAPAAAPVRRVVDAALSFARIARAVRLTVALGARLDDEAKAKAPPMGSLGDAAREELKARFARLMRPDRDWAREDKVRGAVERLIEAETEGEDAERLREALDERLDALDDDEAFDDAPVGELIVRICRDLGLAPDWSRWSDEDWGLDAAAAARAPESG